MEAQTRSVNKFAIRPHPLAPSITKASDIQLILVHLLRELRSANPQINGKVHSLIRQAGLVNLWFFLKVICGAYGPYDKLNSTLHLEICNFRQSDHCLGPGARGAAILPRNHRKSTIMTHGGGTWDLLRDPDERLLIASGILNRSEGFKTQIQRNYDSNPLMKMTYPEWCPNLDLPKHARRRHKWNEDAFEMPNRTRRWAEPSVTARAATGASEGGHYTKELIDDLAGMDDLNIERQGSVSMVSKMQWFQTNTRALLYDQNTSQIIYAATRFGPNDPSQIVTDDCKKVLGYIDNTIKELPNGHWVIYYRSIIEDGIIIQPEATNKEFLDDWREKDFWSYATQGANNIEDTGLNELGSYTPRFCRVYQDDQQRWVISRILAPGEEPIGPKTFFLDSCDAGIYIDPAATEKGLLSKACRTAIGFWAMDADGNYYLIDLRVGQWDIYGVCDEIFAMSKKYDGYYKEVGFEEVSFQRVLRSILERERHQRSIHLNIQGCPAIGDKDVRIRTLIGNPLAQGCIWLNKNCRYGDFIDEQKIFPSNRYRKDVLDMSSMAIQRLSRPLSTEETREQEEQDEEFALAVGRNPITGY
jgi:hypothetical protein